MGYGVADILTPERSTALRALASQYGVKDLRVFGSYARGEAGPGSDFDLLINIAYGRGVARRLVRFCQEATRVMGVKVDVATEDGLIRSLHAGIFRDARAVWWKIGTISATSVEPFARSRPTQRG